MTKTNRSNEVDEVYPESTEAIDILLNGRTAQNEDGERKPLLTRNRKIALGGLGGIVTAAALGLGTIGMVPCALGGLYVGAVGIEKGIQGIAKAGWTVAKGLGKGALMAANAYAQSKNGTNPIELYDSAEREDETGVKVQYLTAEQNGRINSAIEKLNAREGRTLSPEYINSIENHVNNFWDRAEQNRVAGEIIDKASPENSTPDYEGVGLADEQRDWYVQNENPMKVALQPAKEYGYNQRAANAAFAHKMRVLEDRWEAEASGKDNWKTR